MSRKETSLRAWQRQAGSRRLSCHPVFSGFRLGCCLWPWDRKAQHRYPLRADRATRPSGLSTRKARCYGTPCSFTPLCPSGRKTSTGTRRGEDGEGDDGLLRGCGHRAASRWQERETGPRPCPEQALPAGGCGMALKTPTKLFSSTPRPPHEHRIRSLTSKRKIFNSRKEKILKF